jgi:hypothetical protein
MTDMSLFDTNQQRMDKLRAWAENPRPGVCSECDTQTTVTIVQTAGETGLGTTEMCQPCFDHDPLPDPRVLIAEMAELLRSALPDMLLMYEEDFPKVQKSLAAAGRLLASDLPAAPRISFGEEACDRFQEMVQRLYTDIVEVTPLDSGRPFDALLLGSRSDRTDAMLDEVLVQPVDEDGDPYPPDEPMYLRVKELKVY